MDTPHYFATSENPADNPYDEQPLPLPAPADTEALNAVRRELITLFNSVEVAYHEKKDALLWMAGLGTDLARLQTWRRNIQAEVERRQQQAVRRKAALHGVLRTQAAQAA